MNKIGRKNKLLENIVKLIENYENPSGHNCSNDVGVEITLDVGRETEQTFSYNGESFVECDKGES